MTERAPTPVRGVTGHALSSPERPAIAFGEVVRTYGGARRARPPSRLGTRRRGRRPRSPGRRSVGERRGALRGGDRGGHAGRPLPAGQLASPRGGAGLHPHRRRGGRRRRPGRLRRGAPRVARRAPGFGRAGRFGLRGKDRRGRSASRGRQPVRPRTAVLHVGHHRPPEGGRARRHLRRRGEGPGHGGTGRPLGVDSRRRLRDDRAGVPRCAPRVGAHLALRRRPDRRHRQLRRPWLARGGEPTARDEDLHGSRPLHPDPRAARATSGPRSTPRVSRWSSTRARPARSR